MYIQDNIEQWVNKYTPDKFEYTIENYYSRNGQKIPNVIRGCAMVFGELIVSIQWSDYNYCDHYVGKSYFTYSPDPIYKGQFKKVHEAEVAVICLTRFDSYPWGITRHFVKFDEYENVKAYASVSEIKDIIEVCATYARA